MGSNPTREPSFYFQKPTDAIQFIAPGKTVDHPYPTLTKNYHYEIELVAAFKSGGSNMSVAEQIVRLSQAFELKAGHIIYSGAPENVGPVVRGYVMLWHIDGLPDISVKVV